MPAQCKDPHQELGDKLRIQEQQQDVGCDLVQLYLTSVSKKEAGCSENKEQSIKYETVLLESQNNQSSPLLQGGRLKSAYEGLQNTQQECQQSSALSSVFQSGNCRNLITLKKLKKLEESQTKESTIDEKISAFQSNAKQQLIMRRFELEYDLQNFHRKTKYIYKQYPLAKQAFIRSVYLQKQMAQRKQRRRQYLKRTK